MSYQTGSVNSFADLKTTLKSFLVTHASYVVDGTNADILTKVDVKAEFFSSATSLGMKSGTGVVAGALTGAFEGRSHLIDDLLAITISWPITYHMHYSSTPDQMFLFIEYNGGYCQNLMLGDTSKPMNYTGGAFYSGSMGSKSDAEPLSMQLDAMNTLSFNISLPSHFGSSGSNWVWQPIPFGGGTKGGAPTADNYFSGSSVHAEIEGQTWFLSGFGPSASSDNQIVLGGPLNDLIVDARNTWNDSTTLVPYWLFGMSDGDKTTERVFLGEITHLRMTDNQDLNFGEIVTLGSDQWKVYPLFFKNFEYKSGSFMGYHALAVRYEP